MNTLDVSRASRPSKSALLGLLWVIQGLVALWGAISMREAGVQPILWLAGFYLAFCGCQYGLLRPIPKPPITTGAAKPPRLWITTILLGLLIGVLLCLAVLLLGDVVWLFCDEGQRKPVYWTFGLVAGLTMLVSWVFFTRFIRAFLLKGPIDVQLRRTANRLFLGSVVEVIAGIPIYTLISRRENCICAAFSGVTILLGSAVAFFLLGPVLLLLLVGWRSRSASLHRCPACGHDRREDSNKDSCPECGAGWKTG
jgi:hypothetical protein